jgi:C4-dicarboxylate transporter, DctM subunit
MMWNQAQLVSFADFGWDFYGPLLGLIVLIILGVPVWVSLGLGAAAMLWFTQTLPMTMLGATLFQGIDHFALIAVPLFILTGDVLVRTGLSEKLLDIAEALTGGIKAGFGTATVVVCGFFACISGSDAAGAAAVSRLTIDRLVRQGYPKPYACALVASGACTGILIPPSIAYIVIGLVLGVSASTLFLAAVIPGLMILLAILVTNLVMNWRYGYEQSGVEFSLARIGRAFWDGRYALMVPVIILGGIYAGIFTPTEAAAVAVVTTIAIGLAQGTLKLADFPAMLLSSAKVNGIILPIIAVSLPLSQTLAALQVPQAFVAGMTALTTEPWLITLIMIGILVVAGLVMETTPNIVLLAPLLLPLSQEIGMDVVQFSILMVTTLGVGFITPPFGLNLFVVSGMTGTPVLAIAGRAIPYVLGMLLVVLLLAYVPAISLWAF